MGISSYLYCWIDEDVGESDSRKGPAPLVCYLLSDCYLWVSFLLRFTYIETSKWIWIICHTKNFTTVVPLSLFCGILCWHDWPWKNIHCCVYRCLPLLHRPTVYLCLKKVSGNITIRNLRTVKWPKKLYQNYGLNMLGRRWGGCFGQALLQTLGPI